MPILNSCKRVSAEHPERKKLKVLAIIDVIGQCAVMPPVVEVDRAHLVEVFRTLNVLVVSLDRFGSWASDQSSAQAAARLMALHEEMDVFTRLANARHVIDSYFDHTIGPDGMDELEQELHDERGYWTAPPS